MATHAHSFETRFVPQSDVLFKHERRTVIWTPHAPGDEPIVLKLYRHRGIVNSVRGMIVKYRAEREHVRLGHLVNWDIPCTRPLSWSHGFSREHGFYEVLATRLVPESIDLQTHLRQGRSCNLATLFATIRRMHKSGFLHQALFARNILVSGGEKTEHEFAVCDLPRSRIFPFSLVGTRMAMLDLTDLVASLRRVGVSWNLISVDAYGLSAANESRLERMVDGYRQDRSYRIARDIESRVRHLTACLGVIIRGRPMTLTR